ncbi:DUF6118 family protein [Sphingopyxis witflariensis]|uniref:Uncharacterized protein n=1 Tax=Sphingopyxis witflariensis TaxID=173675 RepID=A0A246JR34_9SPHN|nr:DUF6118 family protein [Sphingopyxis witflariensis]OWQ95393.1 hypothetical protein CDQ91_14020 [Sphingopyxis witflariensis]
MTRKITPAAPPSNDAAKAFDDLRSEISLQRSAIEGLTSAKEKLPDYLPTLRDMESRLGRMEERLDGIHQQPAMQFTPLKFAAEMFEASKTCRAEDRKAIGDAREELARSLGRIEGMIKKGRSTEEQDWWVTWAATGGVLLGASLALIGVAAWS